jgi:uncharacterized protein YjbJ (UPF0337 family)
MTCECSFAPPTFAVVSFARCWKDEIMDKDQVVGSAKQVEGTVKQSVGRTVGDANLESEGQAEKVEGTIQKAIGGLRNWFKRK